MTVDSRACSTLVHMHTAHTWHRGSNTQQAWHIPALGHMYLRAQHLVVCPIENHQCSSPCRPQLPFPLGTISLPVPGHPQDTRTDTPPLPVPCSCTTLSTLASLACLSPPDSSHPSGLNSSPWLSHVEKRSIATSSNFGGKMFSFL